jgi:GNAT superfamily N-acetyltransferase
MEIKIREANLADYRDINSLYTEELAYHITLLPDIFKMADPVMTEAWYQDQLDNENVVIFIAEVKGSVVGALQVMLRHNQNDPIFKTRHYTHIEELIVAKSHRGLGVGRRLLESAQAWAKARGATAIDLWVWTENQDAIDFYNHLGYKVVRHAMQLKLN